MPWRDGGGAIAVTALTPEPTTFGTVTCCTAAQNVTCLDVYDSYTGDMSYVLPPIICRKTDLLRLCARIGFNPPVI